MAKKGLRFFGTDYNNQQLGGTIDASSAVANADFAFDGLIGTKWISSGENADGNAIYLEMNYGFNRTVDSFFIYNTNISDIAVSYWNGAAYVLINGTNGVITKSADNAHVFVKLNASVNTSKVKITGSNTIVANQEKYVTSFLAFAEIGQLNYFPDFAPVFSGQQDVFATTDGRSFVIERGEAFSATLQFRSHVNQADIDLAETLIARKEPFYIWPCAGDVSIFRFSFRPFRFQDMIKVTVVGDTRPTYTKNYYKAGYNTPVKLIEVV